MKGIRKKKLRQKQAIGQKQCRASWKGSETVRESFPGQKLFNLNRWQRWYEFQLNRFYK